MSESRMEYRKKMELALIGRAESDAAFRAQLIADPKRTVESALGTALPPTISVKVIEENPSELCLVIPANAPAELTDADLEAVSGGGLIKSGKYTVQEPRSTTIGGVRG